MARTTVTFAGYGCYNRTNVVTQNVASAYAGGQKSFTANNLIGGGDPFPGARKYLYIVWDSGDGPSSGVTGEGDDNGINLP